MRWIVNFLIDEWKQAWRMLSVWAFALIGIAPDLYTGIIAMGWLDDANVPPSFVWTLRGLAVVGIAGRLLRQKSAPKPEVKP